MKLSHALRLTSQSRLALVGAGGKTTALFALARVMPTGAVITTTTHLSVIQAGLADYQYSIRSIQDLPAGTPPGKVICLVGVETGDGRVKGPPEEVMEILSGWASRMGLPVLVEADGARGYPLKAPAEHEPQIPDWVDTTVVCAGLSALGKEIRAPFVHRPERFAALAGKNEGDRIDTRAMLNVLSHPQGGLKGIPACSRRVALLNQADTLTLGSLGGEMAADLLSSYQSVLISSLIDPDPEFGVSALYEKHAAVILAAGGSTRFGQPKQLLDWHGKPFIRQVAETALAANFDPVIVVLGANAAQIRPVLEVLPVQVTLNTGWEEGQGSSIPAGVKMCPEEVGSATFLHVDQPQVTVEFLRRLVEEHQTRRPAILAPLVDGQRTTPVLFDRETFADLLQISGDTGGRAIFNRFTLEYLPWLDAKLLIDVDTMEDYQTLLAVTE